MRPILSTPQIHRLRFIAKPLGVDWIESLIASEKTQGPNRRAQLPVMTLYAEPLRGELYLYLRRSLSTAVDFSVGLVFHDEHGYRYPIVRCNGPTPQAHTNRFPKRTGRHTIFALPHIHYLTALYQRQALLNPKAVQMDGHAIPTRLYSSDYRDAIRVLGKKVCIESQGRLLP